MDDLFKELLDEYENHTSNAYCEMGTVSDLIDRCRKAIGIGPAGLDWSHCCGREFRTYKGYQDHCLTEYHINNQPVYCPTCDRTLPNRQVYEGHCRGKKHLKNIEKPESKICQHCDKKSIQVS